MHTLQRRNIERAKDKSSQSRGIAGGISTQARARVEGWKQRKECGGDIDREKDRKER